MIKLRKAKPAPTAPAAPAALDELQTRLQEIVARRKEVIAKIVAAERRGATSGATAARATREQAMALLNGAVVGLLPAVPTKADDLSELRAELIVIDEAIEIAQKLEAEMLNKATQDRIAARADDVRKAMSAIANAVIGVEHALQARDALVAEIRPGIHLVSGQGWMLAGRLGNSETQAYRFLHEAAHQGWITREQFEAEVARARRAQK